MAVQQLNVTHVTMTNVRPDYRLLGAALLEHIRDLDKNPAIEDEYQEWCKRREANAGGTDDL